MEIIVEYVLLENFFINLITLKTTALLTKEKGKLFLLSAFLGACLSVALPIFYLSALGYFLVELGLVTIYVCLSFKFKTIKKFFQLYLTFFVSTFLYGGACYFFEGAFGINSLLVVLAVVVFVYFVVKFLTKKILRKKSVENFCFDVEIDIKGKKSHWKAFLDTGNLLYDPLTSSPVILINYKVFSQLFEDIDLEDVLRKSDQLKSLKLAHYISFNTLNCENKLLVFQADQLSIDGKKTIEKPILGLSLKNFNQAFGTDIILHNNCA